MRRVEMAEATGSLSDYAREARHEPVVVIQDGKPVAALMAVTEDDWEDLVVGTHPGFIALIERSRELCPTGEGIPLDEVKRKYGIRTRATGKSRRRAR